MEKKQGMQKKHRTQKKHLLKNIIFAVIIMIALSSFSGCESDKTDSASQVTSSENVETVVKEEADTKEEESAPRSVEGTDTEDTQSADQIAKTIAEDTPIVTLKDIPTYSDRPYVAINGNVPYFKDQELTTTSFESYSALDNLGRCGVAYASVGQDIMPTEERGAIGPVKPTGWHTVKYDCVDGKYLYNRCHLIGYQLTGENANEENLITGTRYLNVDGMLPFENMVADYVKETSNHVMYRVTPLFDGDNLVASGVLMEAKSVEDKGEGILFNVYCYNNQPNILIDYETGESKFDETTEVANDKANEVTNDTATEATVAKKKTTKSKDKKTSKEKHTYILNTNTKKFHKPSCYSVSRIKESNKDEFKGKREDLINQGYEACKNCNP